MNRYVALLPPVICLIVSALASFFDLRERRIPNQLTYFTLALALAIRTGLFGVHVGLFPALGACLLAGLVFLPLYYLGGLGGGDAKLAIALAAVLGHFSLAAELLLYTALAGGALAIITMLRSGRMKESLARLFSRRRRAEIAPLTMAYGPAFFWGSLVLLIQAAFPQGVT